MEHSQESSGEVKLEVAGFIKKTFEILNNEEFNKIIFWAPNGREFIIKDISKFQDVVLPLFFRHRNINSFIRQLNMYGFHKGKKDSSKCIFSHPNFQREKEPDLHLIKRKFKPTQISEETLASTPEKSVELQPPVVVLAVSARKISFERPVNEPMGSTVKSLRFLISTNQLINTGPQISFLKLSKLELQSLVSEDSDKDDCLSIEDEIEKNNSNSLRFSNRIYGLSLINTINRMEDAIFN